MMSLQTNTYPFSLLAAFLFTSLSNTQAPSRMYCRFKLSHNEGHLSFFVNISSYLLTLLRRRKTYLYELVLDCLNVFDVISISEGVLDKFGCPRYDRKSMHERAVILVIVRSAFNQRLVQQHRRIRKILRMNSCMKK